MERVSGWKIVFVGRPTRRHGAGKKESVIGSPKQSYSYSQSCPATPTKHPARNSQNPSLLTPVTRILSLCPSTSKVKL